jgi:hypothetical protein
MRMGVTCVTHVTENMRWSMGEISLFWRMRMKTDGNLISFENKRKKEWTVIRRCKEIVQKNRIWEHLNIRTEMLSFFVKKFQFMM